MEREVRKGVSSSTSRWGIEEERARIAQDIKRNFFTTHQEEDSRIAEGDRYDPTKRHLDESEVNRELEEAFLQFENAMKKISKLPAVPDARKMKESLTMGDTHDKVRPQFSHSLEDILNHSWRPDLRIVGFECPSPPS